MWSTTALKSRFRSQLTLLAAHWARSVSYAKEVSVLCGRKELFPLCIRRCYVTLPRSADLV